MPIYRYRFVGVDLDAVAEEVPGTPTFDASGTYNVDVSATVGDKDDLDEAMAARGFAYVSTDPADVPNTAEWTREGTLLTPVVTGDGIKIYDITGNEFATWDRSTGNFAISIGGTGSQALYKNCLKEQTQLGGTSSAEYAAGSDNVDGPLWAFRADHTNRFYGQLEVGQSSADTVYHYDSDTAAPTTPSPKDGDRWYNQSQHKEYRYDGSRSKWLSVEMPPFQFGYYYNLAAGAYMRWSGYVLTSAALGARVPYNGTVIGLNYTRSNSLAATFEVVANGSAIAELASSATNGGSTALDGDFSAGAVLTVRNKTGSNIMSNPTVWLEVRWRP